MMTRPIIKETHPHSILQVPTTQLAKMSIDLKFVELTADVLAIYFYKIIYKKKNIFFSKILCVTG